MQKSRLDRFLAPWVFVLTGILFNILSAVITHYFIGLNNDQINSIDRDINNRQVLIDSLWQSRIEVERRQEFFILFLSNKPDNSTLIYEHYQNYLGTLVNSYDLGEYDAGLNRSTNDDLELLLDLSIAARKSIIESINSTYFEVLESEEAKIPLVKDNARLFSIAIFLQVTGLILVLARDLRRQ